jgi:hypothetical protein
MYATVEASVVAVMTNVLEYGAVAGAPVKVTVWLARSAVVDSLTGDAAW